MFIDDHSELNFRGIIIKRREGGYGANVPCARVW